jgi:hypothetical protein
MGNWSIGRFIGRIASCLEVVPTLVRLKQIADVADGAPERIEGAHGRLAQTRLELGEGLFDRIEIGRIGWQEQEPGAPLLRQLCSLGALG